MTSDLAELIKDAEAKIAFQLARIEKRKEQIKWLQHYGYACSNGKWSAPPAGNRKKGRQFPSANLAYKWLRGQKAKTHLPDLWQP